MDSNRKVIEPALQKLTNYKIKSSKDIYTTKQLHDTIQDNPEYLKYDTTKVIMLGTNDLRTDHHSEAIEIIKEIGTHANQETL